MTINTTITPDTDLTNVPCGTNIEILGKNVFGDIDVNVTHEDELTLKRLITQTWGIEWEFYIELDLI